jgi:hypothetical protein
MSRFSDALGALRRKLPRLGLPEGIDLRLLLLIPVSVVILWFVVMGLTHKIDDSTGFGAATPAGKGSATVAVIAALIDREVNAHDWVANAPFFSPKHYLDNMPNYQQGIIYALARFTVQLGDQIGRARGSSQVDPDLDRAVGLLKYPGNVWVFDPKTSLVPTAPSETQYRRARTALLSYNERLAGGGAVFDPRSDNLVATLDNIAADLGSQSAIIEAHLRGPGFWLTEGHSDDIFYSTKGRLYAYYLILREMRKDFAQVIEERDLASVWNNMLDSFQEAVELDPAVIVNGSPDSQFLPSHLASQGFYLLRARTNLREITGILSR